MKAKLPNGLVMQFPAGTSQAEIDATVQDYMKNKDANVKKYLLNNEAIEAVIKLSSTLVTAVETMNQMLTETQKRQEAMITQFNAAVNVLSKSLDDDGKSMDKLKKSVDVMANISQANTKAIVASVDKLSANIGKPIKFKHDDSGNVVEAG